MRSACQLCWLVITTRVGRGAAVLHVVLPHAARALLPAARVRNTDDAINMHRHAVTSEALRPGLHHLGHWRGSGQFPYTFHTADVC